MSSIITAKASAVLILVIAVSLVQVTVSLMPKNSNLANISAESAAIPAPEYGAKTYPGPPTTAASTAVSSAPANQTVTLAITQTLTMPSTVATTVVVTNSTTLLAQSIAGPDYTPVGIAIVAAVAIIVLALMFLRRRR